VRTWALDSIADGALTVAEVKNGRAATRAFVAAATAPVPIAAAPQHLAPLALRGDSPYTPQGDLEILMAQAIAMRRR